MHFAQYPVLGSTWEVVIQKFSTLLQVRNSLSTHAVAFSTKDKGSWFYFSFFQSDQQHPKAKLNQYFSLPGSHLEKSFPSPRQGHRRPHTHQNAGSTQVLVPDLPLYSLTDLLPILPIYSCTLGAAGLHFLTHNNLSVNWSWQVLPLKLRRVACWTTQLCHSDQCSYEGKKRVPILIYPNG